MAEAKKTIKKAVKATTAKTEKKSISKEEATIANEAVTEVSAKKPAKKETTKAGKRSPKAIKEAEAKDAKEEHKALIKEGKVEATPKKLQTPPRSKLERRGKKYREAAKLIEVGKEYPLSEAIALAVKTSLTKFDATLELHINLNVDPKLADQNVRGTVVLPAGSGKTSRIAVLAEVDDAKKAKAAGADMAGSDEIFAQLDKEKMGFDVLIAAPTMMAKLGKYARLLGPKGLMPNPKSGTVTNDVVKAVQEAKAGKVEYRVDTTGIIHVGIGKVSFGAEKLTENAQAILTNLKTHKPASVKGALIARAYATTTMGPSVPLSLSDV